MAIDGEEELPIPYTAMEIAKAALRDSPGMPMCNGQVGIEVNLANSPFNPHELYEAMLAVIDGVDPAIPTSYSTGQGDFLVLAKSDLGRIQTSLQGQGIAQRKTNPA